MVSVAVLGVLAALAIPALGNLLSRNQARSVAISFQDDLRLARYDARSHSNSVVTFCSIASSVKNPTSINCGTAQGYTNGWLWYTGTTLLGKNYAPLDAATGVTPTLNFLVEIAKNNTTLWNKDNPDRNSDEISIPYGPVGNPTYPSITFSDTSGTSSIVEFNETGRTSVKHH